MRENNPMYEICSVDGVDIPHNPKWRRIAISLSGGADSALLTYLLCSMAPNNFTVHIISHTRMWKTRPWQSYDSNRVFDWFVSRFPKIKFERHTSFIAPDVEYGNMGPNIKDEYGKWVSGDNAQQRAYAEYVCTTKDIPAYYNAVTRNPKDVDFKGMEERDVDPTDNNMHLRVVLHMDRWAVHPFRFVNKAWVIKQYKRLDLIDLLGITRSCEGEFTGTDYTNYKPGQYVPICRECFWCKEREWAINENN